MKKKKIDRIIDLIRENLQEDVPTNNASSGNIAGLPPDDPPVYLNKKKKRKPSPIGRYGTRRNWMRKDGNS